MASWGKGASTVKTPSVLKVLEMASGFVPKIVLLLKINFNYLKFLHNLKNTNLLAAWIP